MLTPVPGLTHLQVLNTTPALTSPEPPAESSPEKAQPRMSPLILMALQAAFGMREINTLPRNRFAPVVYSQISARLRSSALRGPVRLVTVHRQQHAEHSEFYGSALGAGHLVGFTAVSDGHRINSFRII